MAIESAWARAPLRRSWLTRRVALGIRAPAPRLRRASSSASALLDAAQSSVGHALGLMARFLDAEVLVLSTRHALAGRVAMAVWTTVAQCESRRCRRHGGGKNYDAE